MNKRKKANVRRFYIPDEMKKMARKYKRTDPVMAHYLKLGARYIDAASKHQRETIAKDVLELERLYALIDPRPEKHRSD